MYRSFSHHFLCAHSVFENSRDEKRIMDKHKYDVSTVCRSNGWLARMVQDFRAGYRRTRISKVKWRVREKKPEKFPYTHHGECTRIRWLTNTISLSDWRTIRDIRFKERQRFRLRFSVDVSFSLKMRCARFSSVEKSHTCIKYKSHIISSQCHDGITIKYTGTSTLYIYDKFAQTCHLRTPKIV